MTINQLLPSQMRAAGLQRADGEEDSKVKRDTGESASRERSDRVEISPEGRVLSSQTPEALEEDGALDPARLAEVHQRMQDGTYDTPEMAEEVARRILISGDLDV